MEIRISVKFTRPHGNDVVVAVVVVVAAAVVVAVVIKNENNMNVERRLVEIRLVPYYIHVSTI